MLPFIARNVSVLFWTRQIMCGLIGLTLNILTSRSVKLSSPLTHNLTGIVKRSVQAIVAVALFRNEESMAPLKTTGLLLILVSGALYVWANKCESADIPMESESRHEVSQLAVDS
jgi:hypothetical protein